MIAQSSVQRRLQVLSILVLAGCAAPGALAAQQRDTAGAQPPAPPAPPEQSCKCDPKRVGQCFTVHGSLSLYRSAPTARISIVGTKRVLGLKEGVPEWLEEDLEVPQNAVLADFLVCPLTRAKRGTMQLVCVDAANNMVVTQKP